MLGGWEPEILLAGCQSKPRFRDAWTFWLLLLSWTPSSPFKSNLFLLETVGEQEDLLGTVMLLFCECFW